MIEDEINYCPAEEELPVINNTFNIPRWIRNIAGTISILLIIGCLSLYTAYVIDPTKYVSPDSLGLSGILIFSLSTFFIIIFPWKDSGIKIKKIGIIEFSQIVETQNKEHIESITYLQDRIECLEKSTEGQNTYENIIHEFEEPKLRKVLLSFLETYSPTAFSPSRVRVWGSKQHDYESIKDFSHGFIRNTLQKLVVEGELETRLSKMGNTLYRTKR